MDQVKAKEILLESGTNELEVLELVVQDVGPDGQGRSNHYGINVAKVMQVIENPGLLAPRSAANPAFLGMISLRDRMVPILDLAVMLGLQRQPSPHEVVIVTEFSQAVRGFLVSAVTDIHRLQWRQVMPPDSMLGAMARGVIIGLVEMVSRYIQLLDMESLLSELDGEAPVSADLAAPRVGKRYKALAADDSATIRVMLRKLFESANFDLEIVNNGEDALARLEEIKQEVLREGRPLSDCLDVLIADIEMPRMDGYSLTRRVKEDPVLGTMPVILYSSLIYDEVLHKGESVGADIQVSKPEMGRMAEMAVELLEKRDQGRI